MLQLSMWKVKIPARRFLPGEITPAIAGDIDIFNFAMPPCLVRPIVLASHYICL